MSETPQTTSPNSSDFDSNSVPDSAYEGEQGAGLGAGSADGEPASPTLGAAAQDGAATGSQGVAGTPSPADETAQKPRQNAGTPSSDQKFAPVNNGPTSQQMGLTQAVHEIEKSASTLGWDRPSTVYALVPTSELLELEELPADMRAHLQAGWDGTASALTAVIQEDLPGSDLEDTLAQLAWPDSVVGAAVCTERVMVPPEAQAQAPDDPTEALEYFANHPDRDEVRIVAGVLRTGEAWCAIRARSHDRDDEVAEGSNLVPGLVEALFATFVPAEERGRTGGGCGCGSGAEGGCGCGSGSGSAGGCGSGSAGGCGDGSGDCSGDCGDGSGDCGDGSGDCSGDCGGGGCGCGH